MNAYIPCYDTNQDADSRLVRVLIPLRTCLYDMILSEENGSSLMGIESAVCQPSLFGSLDLYHTLEMSSQKPNAAAPNGSECTRFTCYSAYLGQLLNKKEEKYA